MHCRSGEFIEDLEPDHLSSPRSFSGIRITQSLFLCVMFYRSTFVLLFFFFWSMCCLFFFDVRILITPLVSSNSSYKRLPLSTFYIMLANVLRSHINKGSVVIRGHMVIGFTTTYAISAYHH